MASTTIRAPTGAREAQSWAPKAIGETEVRLILGGAMVVSLVLGLWFSRNTTFSVDELDWFSTSPNLDLRGAIEPYNGHLILTSRLVYAAILNAFGDGYLPFRLLTLGTVLLTAGLFFVFAERRIGAVAALAPTLVLLFYGSAPYHVLSGNGFTVLLALAAGVGALLALEREDRGGYIAACLLLCLAVVTYSVALAFLVAAAVLVLTSSDRARRVWVFLVPALLYGAWLLWSRDHGQSSDTVIKLSNVWLVPNWALDSLGNVGAAVLGLDYDFDTGSGLDTAWGPLIALIALIALGWRLSRGHVPRWLWAVLAVPATLWAIQGMAASPGFRTPASAQYIYPGTLAVLLVAAEAARGVRLGRRGVLALYAVAAISLATNIALLRDGSNKLRARATQIRTDLTAVEVGGGRLGPRPSTSAGTPIDTELLGAVLRLRGQQNVATGYIDAVRQYGSPAFSLPELRAQAEPVREFADAALAHGLGLRLQPTSAPARHCQRIAGQSGGGTSFRLPTGAVVLRTKGVPAPLLLRRFGTAFKVEAGQLAPGVPMALSVPGDSAPDPWYASTSATPLSICRPAA